MLAEDMIYTGQNQEQDENKIDRASGKPIDRGLLERMSGQETLRAFTGFTEDEIRASVALCYLFYLNRKEGYDLLRDKSVYSTEEIIVQSVANTAISINDIEDYLDMYLMERYLLNNEPNPTEAQRYSDEIIQKILLDGIFHGYILGKTDKDAVEEEKELDASKPIDAAKITMKDIIENRLIFVTEDEYRFATMSKFINLDYNIDKYETSDLKFSHGQVMRGEGKIRLYLKKKGDTFFEPEGVPEEVHESMYIEIPLEQLCEFFFKYEFPDDGNREMAKKVYFSELTMRYLQKVLNIYNEIEPEFFEELDKSIEEK